MILDIVTYPDKRLQQVCQPIPAPTPELRQLAADMLETMYAAPGVGLAAPQVGHSIRMLVMDPAGKDEKPQPLVLLNPVLQLGGEEIRSEQEGCLSVPLQYRADVLRRERVVVDAMDLDGAALHLELDGFPAIIVQHEYDHLDGILFIDKISRLRRSLYDGKVKKWLKRKNAG